MALIPYEPFRHLEHFRRGLDNFFSEFPPFFFGDINTPRVDVYETENEVVASCELPGLRSKEDVQISVDDNMLRISGTINKVHEVKEEHLYRRERFAGSFQRSVSLPARVKGEEATATYKNGILEVRMPKMETGKQRNIDIQFH